MKQITLTLFRVLVVCWALDVQRSTVFGQGVPYNLLTITNPTPAAREYFGASVAVLGNDRALIGAEGDDAGASDAGAAYLFSANGTLLHTFTNPTPTELDYFGNFVGTAGTGLVLIAAPGGDTGASNAGVVHVFTTNGTLLTTFTNPTPAIDDRFGIFAGAVGTDRVLIGAYLDDTGATNTGAAYLFRTNGALLTTFTNPTPATDDWFGITLAAVGTDRVLIAAVGDSAGAQASGAAYLFSTNGALLTTVTNPTPGYYDYFGSSVAAVGTDRVLIGAVGDSASALASGVAYLFSTNGELLTTFTNPTPAMSDQFGACVAAVGSDRVLIGAVNGGAAGAAYLFSTNGTLLHTFTNPAPASLDAFGYFVAAAGTELLLVGTPFADTGATNAGAAYLFSLESRALAPPTLTIFFTTTSTVAVSWPSPSTSWTLQENTNGVSSANWSNAPGPIQDDGTNKMLIVSPTAGSRFYRLVKP